MGSPGSDGVSRLVEEKCKPAGAMQAGVSRPEVGTTMVGGGIWSDPWRVRMAGRGERVFGPSGQAQANTVGGQCLRPLAGVGDGEPGSLWRYFPDLGALPGLLQCRGQGRRFPPGRRRWGDPAAPRMPRLREAFHHL